MPPKKRKLLGKNASESSVVRSQRTWQWQGGTGGEVSVLKCIPTAQPYISPQATQHPPAFTRCSQLSNQRLPKGICGPVQGGAGLVMVLVEPQNGSPTPNEASSPGCLQALWGQAMIGTWWVVDPVPKSRSTTSPQTQGLDGGRSWLHLILI